MRTGISSKKSARRFRGGSQHTRRSGIPYMPSGPVSRGKKPDPAGCPPSDFIVADCHEDTSRPWPRDNNFTILQACPNACSEWMGRKPGYWTIWTKEDDKNYTNHLATSQSEWARGIKAQQVASSKVAEPRSRRAAPRSRRAAPAAPAAPRLPRPSKGKGKGAVGKFKSKSNIKSKASLRAPAGKFSTRRNASASSQSSRIRYGSQGQLSLSPTLPAVDESEENQMTENQNAVNAIYAATKSPRRLRQPPFLRDSQDNSLYPARREGSNGLQEAKRKLKSKSKSKRYSQKGSRFRLFEKAAKQAGIKFNANKLASKLSARAANRGSRVGRVSSRVGKVSSLVGSVKPIKNLPLE